MSNLIKASRKVSLRNARSGKASRKGVIYANHTPRQHLLHLTLFRICISVGLWSLGAGWALASAGETIAAKPVVPFVKEIRVDTSEEEKRVIWRFGAAPSAFSAFSLSEPARLVVDIHTSNMFAPSRTYPLGDNVIKQIRQGTHPVSYTHLRAHET